MILILTDDPGFDYFHGTPASLDQPPFVRMENDRAITQPTTFIGVRNLNRRDASRQFDVEYGPAEEGYDPQALCRRGLGLDAACVARRGGADAQRPRKLALPL